jgi:hypothetical protein
VDGSSTGASVPWIWAGDVHFKAMDDYPDGGDGRAILYRGGERGRVADDVHSEGLAGKDKESNWLPAPEVNSMSHLRLYWPKPKALEGKWKPAPVVRPD